MILNKPYISGVFIWVKYSDSFSRKWRIARYKEDKWKWEKYENILNGKRIKSKHKINTPKNITGVSSRINVLFWNSYIVYLTIVFSANLIANICMNVWLSNIRGINLRLYRMIFGCYYVNLIKIYLQHACTSSL